jgi:hypothetical protein
MLSCLYVPRSKEPFRLEVADRLHSAAIHLLRHARKQDVLAKVGPARLSALSVLVFGGPMALGQLAAAEQVKAPTMSRIVAGLKRSGLARRLKRMQRRAADSRDRNGQRGTVTAAGQGAEGGASGGDAGGLREAELDTLLAGRRS